MNRRELKERKNNINKLLSKITRSPYVLECKSENNEIIIEPLLGVPTGISLKTCQSLFLDYYERWIEETSDNFKLAEYHYKINYFSDKEKVKDNKVERLFSYELHPNVDDCKHEHINIEHPKPFNDKIHYYNKMDFLLDNTINISIFEKLVFKTITDELLKKDVVDNYERHISY